MNLDLLAKTPSVDSNALTSTNVDLDHIHVKTQLVVSILLGPLFAKRFVPPDWSLLMERAETLTNVSYSFTIVLLEKYVKIHMDRMFAMNRVMMVELGMEPIVKTLTNAHLELMIVNQVSHVRIGSVDSSAKI